MTQPCIWPVRPMASTWDPVMLAAARAPAIAVLAARHQSSGLLLGPADVLGVDGSVFAGRGSYYFAVAVDENCPGSASAYVDTKKHSCLNQIEKSLLKQCTR